MNTASVAGGEATRTAAGDTVVAETLSPAQRGPDEALAIPSAERPQAESVADNNAALALWDFLTMLISGVVAVFGGFYGTHNRHWMAIAGLKGRKPPDVTREGITSPPTPHKV